MVMWKRDTPWRQGHCLTHESARSLGLLRTDAPEDTTVIVISHDCDLTQVAQTEPHVEVIAGRFITTEDGNFTSAKNPRRLHLPCKRGGVSGFLDISATDKRLLAKVEGIGLPVLLGHHPDMSCVIEEDERTILQVWLAARYRRSAFPDEFDRRLKDKTKLAEKLSKILEPTKSHIRAVFFDVDKNKEISRHGPDESYELTIILLYCTHQDPEAARAAAESARDKILTAFESQCYNKATGKWQWIELQGVEVISDEGISYAASQELQKWNIDHISLRSDSIEPIMQE